MNKNMNKCPNCGVTSEEVKCATCNVDMVKVEEAVAESTEAAVATEEVVAGTSEEGIEASTKKETVV